MAEHNVWDKGRWAGVEEASIDFMTRYIFEQMTSRFSFRDKRILELGCGTGRLSYLALKEGAAHVTLVDSSVKAAALARKLFSGENTASYSILHSDIFDFAPAERFDLVFSSGLIEHFKGEDRQRIISKHMELSGGECIIIHPTDTLYSALFNRFPPAVKLYGFQDCFSDLEMNSCLIKAPRVARYEHHRFHPFYTVPLLHNLEKVNRAWDRLGGSRMGGLTLTLVKLAPVQGK